MYVVYSKIINIFKNFVSSNLNQKLSACTSGSKIKLFQYTVSIRMGLFVFTIKFNLYNVFKSFK